MESWFEIIEVRIREGRLHIQGHWMVGKDRESGVPRNLTLSQSTWSR